ncbi:glycoside hydrolase superfamily [Obelidium mucronatum]|nr:glycoside hydrolase superfamily [Obelidium mucronatum]
MVEKQTLDVKKKRRFCLSIILGSVLAIGVLIALILAFVVFPRGSSQSITSASDTTFKPTSSAQPEQQPLPLPANATVSASYSVQQYLWPMPQTELSLRPQTRLVRSMRYKHFHSLLLQPGSIYLANITDFPKFPYRGLLLDTARNFFLPTDLKRILDGMAASKMNVLHWHLYDSQSFPIEWKAHPEIHVNNIVDYAFHLNIRVIPEFELPGHNAVFGHVDPSYIAGWNHTPWDEYCVQPPYVGSWFKDPVIHVGHDEVSNAPYGSRNVLEMMRSFETQLVAILRKNGKQYAGWDEISDVYGIQDLIPKNAIVTVWRSPGLDRIKASVAAGFQNIVVGPSSHWYLDCSPSAEWCSQPFERENPATSYNAPGFITRSAGQWHRWETVYGLDILQGVENPDVIKGGFGALWTETIKRHNIDRYLFPRLSVIGERLWSYNNVAFDSITTSQRLNRFRSSLVNEWGIDAADIGYTGNSEGVVYRPEICDRISSQAGWQLGTILVGNPSTGNTNAYCPIANLYNTNQLVHLVPEKVKLDF